MITLDSADIYSIMENMRKSKHMIEMINVWVYCGNIPTNISAYRWNAMCKFIEKNFDELKIAP